MITLKSIHWKESMFFYVEDEKETWWAFSSFLKFLNLKDTPKRVLTNYSFSSWPQKKFGDFSLTATVLPKQTLFLPKNKMHEFLTYVYKTKHLLEKSDFEFFLQQIADPQGEAVGAKQSFATGASKKPRRTSRKLEETESNNVFAVTEQERVLLAFIQKSFELSSFAQQLIQSENPAQLSEVDFQRLLSGIRLLEDTVNHLHPASQEPPSFIDVEVLEN